MSKIKLIKAKRTGSSMFFVEGSHSYKSLGSDFYVDMHVEHVPNSRLLLFNKDLADELNLELPSNDEALEQLIIKNFSWFKYDKHNCNRTKNEITKTFFATRYQDSDDKLEGSALGDGRATWVGEIINELNSKRAQYFDVVLKGTGITPLAWVSHPRESHKDGQVGLTEAVHEYIYSLAAKTNGINAVGILAVIELPFDREVDQEKAVIVVRVGNHLRFAHYCYFSDNPDQLKQIFEYGLKRDMGLSLAHSVNAKDVQSYLEFVVINLAAGAAVYFDVHAVHGSPTFGNVTSCGGTIDFATFVYPDAHHNHYRYMSDGVNSLGGEWGQTEQFFNLFSKLVSSLKTSNFKYADEIKPVEYFLESFNEKFEQVVTDRWLKRIGLSMQEIDLLSIEKKERFYEIVKLIYELNGSKKIQFKKRKIFMAAFEPRKILSGTADCIKNFDDEAIIWARLFKVNRSWGTYKLANAKPYIFVYRKIIIEIVKALKVSKKDIAVWQERSKAIKLSDRNEPGEDLFYNAERFVASKEVLQKIKLEKVSWRKMSESAERASSKLVDHGLVL